jgi:hypothetical protein
VSWNSSQGRTHGTVVRTQRSGTHIDGHRVAASKDNPQFILKSDKSGDLAAHRADALTKGS